MTSHETQSTWTLNDEARASNPGNTRVNYIKWVLNYPRWPVILGSVFLLSVLLGFLHWSAWIIAGLAFLANFLYWARVSNHFQYGCINPAIIVSTEPMMYAAYTDLTKGEGSYPAIRIVEKRFKMVDGSPPKVGKGFATVALYVPGDDSLPHWVSFDPKPIDCVTNDREQVAAAMRSFDSDDWDEFIRALSQVPKPFEPGLYMIQPEF